jgi:hypothetical protein
MQKRMARKLPDPYFSRSYAKRDSPRNALIAVFDVAKFMDVKHELLKAMSDESRYLLTFRSNP